MFSIAREEFIRHPHVIISLTTGKNEATRVPASSGLNWGQRPGRNPNQAYLPVTAEIQRSNFFPPKGVSFTVLTDDGFKFDCIRAQQNGKAIHSSDNSQLGIYFRKRMGVGSGGLITLNRLLRYGRTNVTIYKKSEDVFVMDFSVDEKNKEQIS